MGRLLQKLPPRMLDPLFRTQTYVDRRRGMPDPERERRQLRTIGRAPLPAAGQEDQAQETVKYGTATFNPVNQLAGGGETTTVTVTGIDGSGVWVCAANLTTLPTNWHISANATGTDTCTVRISNNSGAAADPASGTLICRCSKQA